MAFTTSPGHSHSPIPVTKETPREISKRKADGEAGAEDTDVEEGIDVDSEEGTDAD